MNSPVSDLLNLLTLHCSAAEGATPFGRKLDQLTQLIMELEPQIVQIANNVDSPNPEIYGRIMSVFAPRPDLIPVYVILKPLVPAEALHFYDADLGGHFQVLVPGYLSDDMQAALALDLFHSEIAIKVLDDFDIQVAKTIECPDDYENNTLIKLGDFVGLTEATLL